MATAFTELGLAPELLAVTGELGDETPTEWDPLPDYRRAADGPLLCYDAAGGRR